MHVSEPAFAGWNDFGHFCDHVLRIKSAVEIDDQIIDYVAECCTLGEIYRVIEPSKGVLSHKEPRLKCGAAPRHNPSPAVETRGAEPSLTILGGSFLMLGFECKTAGAH